MNNTFTCNTVFNEKQKLQKAFVAFKRDPAGYNAQRIKAVAQASIHEVVIENALHKFVHSIEERPQYAGYVHLFNELLSK